GSEGGRPSSGSRRARDARAGASSSRGGPPGSASRPVRRATRQEMASALLASGAGGDQARTAPSTPPTRSGRSAAPGTIAVAPAGGVRGCPSGSPVPPSHRQIRSPLDDTSTLPDGANARGGTSPSRPQTQPRQ